MEAQEEMVIKKKRSKRPRTTFSSLSLTMASTSSCSTTEGGHDINFNCNRASASPPSSSGGGLAREEEDMANCLILLAQGHAQQSSSGQEPPVQVTPKAAAKDQTTYQCKTCNRCFPSFQALGGHRASHKKPKSTTPREQKPSLPLLAVEQESSQLNEESTTLSLHIHSSRASCSPSNNNKTRVHECSICGAEFHSGQALGGHMRRHRPIPMVPISNQQESQEAKMPRTLLALDLNLPAPEDDHHLETKFPFPGNEQVVVFSASSLVDCHY